ncbi:hypothetical protein C8R45DRAFT_1027617, partial [Mycena sanguinolenta]
RGSYPCHSGAATAPSLPLHPPLPICLALRLALALAQAHEPHVIRNPLFHPGGIPSVHIRISGAWRAALLAPSAPTTAAVKGQGRRIGGAGIGGGRPSNGSDCGEVHESARHHIVDSSVRSLSHTAPSPLSNPMRAVSTDTQSPHPPLRHYH